jgi:Na+-transporting NADH:ubiquinone oxidoreductase subunit D
MSTETLEKEVKEVKKTSEPLLSKKRKALLTNPLDEDNPITIQVLGICSALAVTVALKPTLVMAIAVTAVLVLANVVISALRNTIPNRIRIIVQLVVVASLVAIVDQVLKAYSYDVWKEL